MKGTRPLDNNEIRLVSACFCGKYKVRNRGLFLLGVSTGRRISELLRLTPLAITRQHSAISNQIVSLSHLEAPKKM